MIIGIPKEIKTQEHRVALLPSAAYQLIKHGHKVVVETQAGADIGFCDQNYRDAGAEIVQEHAEVFERAGAAKLVQERNLDEGKLAALALSILNDPATSERMAAAARSLAIPDAAERVCAAIESTFPNP